MNSLLKIFFSLLIVSFIGCSSTSISIQFRDNLSKKTNHILLNGKIAQFNNDSLYYIDGNISIVDGKIDSILTEIPPHYNLESNITDLIGA